MPRQARQKSATSVYHIIIRGINKHDIFHDEIDKRKFIKTIIETKEKYKYELYSYCLMSNHVHLVIKDCDDKLAKFMQAMEVIYSDYYNQKYERVGHLFQNRFLSKPIESDNYLLTVIRYIHQNPEKASICETCYYKWSSYNDYIYGKGIIDNDFFLSLFSDDKTKAIELYKKFHEENEIKKYTDDYIEFEMITQITDDEVIDIIKYVTGLPDVKLISQYNDEIRNEYLKEICKVKGIQFTQLSRILDIGRKVIEKVSKKD